MNKPNDAQAFHQTDSAVTLLRWASPLIGGSEPTFIKGIEAALETFYYHSSCPFLADRPPAIGPFHLGLGDYGEWSEHSGLGEWDRVRDRGRIGGGALA